jgi:hypothetical protein
MGDVGKKKPASFSPAEVVKGQHAGPGGSARAECDISTARFGRKHDSGRHGRKAERTYRKKNSGRAGRRRAIAKMVAA